MSDTGADTSLLEATLDRLFTERSGPDARQAAEAEGWAADCWDALAESGLPWVGVAEEAGGSGGDILDACSLVRLAGRHAVPLPLAECSLLGGWLISTAGVQLPADGGPISVAVPRAGDRVTLEGDRVTARLQRVPWGGRVSAVAAVATSAEPDGDAPRVVLLDPAQADRTPGRNLAGEPRDALTWDGAAISAERVGSPATDPRPELAVRGALSRALLMAGAMEAVADLTIEYSGQRHQFGKAIATFQAVANRLVRMSSEAEAGILAAAVAARRFASDPSAVAFEVGVAKAATSRAASEVATHAHQVHGAIGMTQEYALHHFTRRLWAWRQEWGSERHWASTVGDQVVAAGADQLWPRVATGLVVSS